MRIAVVIYGQTFNTGNFSSKRYEVTAELGEDEQTGAAVLKVSDKLRKIVALMHEQAQKEERSAPTDD